MKVPHPLQTKMVISLQEGQLPKALYRVQKEHQAVSHSSPFSHIRALEGQLLSSFPPLSSLQLLCTLRQEVSVTPVLSITHWHCLQIPAFALSRAAIRH
jgi:hypothetical protein